MRAHSFALHLYLIMYRGKCGGFVKGSLLRLSPLPAAARKLLGALLLALPNLPERYCCLSHFSHTSGQYPTVACLPLRTMGWRKSCWFSNSLSACWLSSSHCSRPACPCPCALIHKLRPPAHGTADVVKLAAAHALFLHIDHLEFDLPLLKPALGLFWCQNFCLCRRSGCSWLSPRKIFALRIAHYSFLDNLQIWAYIVGGPLSGR